MSNKKTESLRRLLDVAADAFIASRFSEVSITAISRAAHCSTATIYEAFEDKNGLFVAALARRLKDHLNPTFEQTEEELSRCALGSLLTFASLRVDWLSSPSRRALTQAIISQTELMQRTLADALSTSRLQTAAQLDRMIKRALQQNTLRTLPVETIRYNVMAISAYETSLQGLVGGMSIPVDQQNIIRHLFLPLVSKKGLIVLTRFLALNT